MEYITDIFNQLLSAGSEALAAILVIALGYALRMMVIFPNKYIPVTIWTLGMLIYVFLKPTGDVPQTTAHPLVWKFVIGFVISFLSWTLHKAAIKPLEAKFPWLQNFFDSVSGDNSGENKP